VEIVADRGSRAPYPPAARMGQRIQAEALDVVSSSTRPEVRRPAQVTFSFRARH
jgi:hypothetical protein